MYLSTFGKVCNRERLCSNYCLSSEQYRTGLVCCPWLRRSRFRRTHEVINWIAFLQFGINNISRKLTHLSALSSCFHGCWDGIRPNVLSVQGGSPHCVKNENVWSPFRNHMLGHARKLQRQSTVDRSQGTQIPQCPASVTWGHGRMITARARGAAFPQQHYLLRKITLCDNHRNHLNLFYFHLGFCVLSMTNESSYLPLNANGSNFVIKPNYCFRK